MDESKCAKGDAAFDQLAAQMREYLMDDLDRINRMDEITTMKIDPQNMDREDCRRVWQFARLGFLFTIGRSVLGRDI